MSQPSPSFDLPLAIITLAAGKGSRMRSDLPKVLHTLAGKPMLQHVLDSASQLAGARQYVVIGHGAEQVQAAIAQDVCWAIQQQQQGTGHAVAQALPEVPDDALVLVLYGDVPLITPATLSALLQQTHASKGQDGGLALLTIELVDATGYGRIVRDESGNIQAIVEHKEATPEQRIIREVNTGILAVAARHLRRWLPLLSANNVQGEYYLLRLGVALADPARLDIRGSLTVGHDVAIDVGCIFEGDVILGDGVTIGPYCVIRNSQLAAATRVEAYCHIDEAAVAQACVVGPYARLRPGADLANGARVGNFCEVKKAHIGAGSKVNHLSYIGDAEVGTNVNIGAGTITCNYDGVNKALTRIGDNAFIGSNSALVAPVAIGANVTIGAGSVIVSPVADHQLAIARGKQRNIDGWQRPVKKC